MADFDIPLKVRKAVYARAQHRCEQCGRRLALELHHLRYRDDDGLLIYGSETRNDLRALCRDCHHQQHLDPNGEFWHDPEAMAEHWDPYHDALEKP